MENFESSRSMLLWETSIPGAVLGLVSDRLRLISALVTGCQPGEGFLGTAVSCVGLTGSGKKVFKRSCAFRRLWSLVFRLPLVGVCCCGYRLDWRI